MTYGDDATGPTAGTRPTTGGTGRPVPTATRKGPTAAPSSACICPPGDAHGPTELFDEKGWRYQAWGACSCFGYRRVPREPLSDPSYAHEDALSEPSTAAGAAGGSAGTAAGSTTS